MFTGTNYVLSDDPNELSANYTIPVQITDNGDVTKDDWGLDNHPDLIGLQIMYKGTRARYFGQDGAMKMPEDIYATNMELDENSVVLFPSVAKANVTVHRPIKAGQWAAISLPFDLNEEQVIEIFGEGTRVAEYDGLNYLTGWWDYEFKFDISFKTQTVLSLNSGIPYIIYPSNNVDIIHVEKIKVCNEEKKADAYGLVPGDNQLLFHAKLKKSGHSRGYYIANDNKIKAFQDNGTLKGFRGYFYWLYSDDEWSKSFNLNICFDDEPTGINSIQLIRNTSKTIIYNMSGQNIGTSHEKLQKGIYLINGKKVVIK